MSEQVEVKKNADYVFEQLVLKEKENEDTGRIEKTCQLYTLQFDVETYMNEYPCTICKNITERHDFIKIRNQFYNKCKRSGVTVGPIGLEVGQPWIKILSKKKLIKAQVVQYLKDKKQVPEANIGLWLVS